MKSMAITISDSLDAGFFDSTIQDPRKYNANQMANILDGIITEGVFKNKMGKFNFETTVRDGEVSLVINTGKAWLNNKWIYSNSVITINHQFLSQKGATSGTYNVWLLLSTLKTNRFAKFVIAQTSDASIVDDSNNKYYLFGRFSYNPSTTSKISGIVSNVGNETGDHKLPFVKSNIENNNTDHEEIVDARTGYDEVEYETLGDSIREQCNNLDSKIDENEDTIINNAYSSLHTIGSNSEYVTVPHSKYVKNDINNGAPKGLYVPRFFTGDQYGNGAKLDIETWNDYWCKTNILDLFTNFIMTINDHSSGELYDDRGYIMYGNSNPSNISVTTGDLVFVPYDGLLPNRTDSGVDTKAGLYKVKSPITLDYLDNNQWNTYFEKTSILKELRYLYSNKLNNSNYTEIYTETLAEAMTLGVTKDITLPGSYDNILVIFYNNSGTQVDSIRLKVRYDSNDGQTNNLGFTESSGMTFYTSSNLYVDIRTYGSLKIANSGRNGAQESRYTNLDNPGKITTLHITCTSGSGYNPLPANTIIRIFGNNNI